MNIDWFCVLFLKYTFTVQYKRRLEANPVKYNMDKVESHFAQKTAWTEEMGVCLMQD